MKRKRRTRKRGRERGGGEREELLKEYLMRGNEDDKK